MSRKRKEQNETGCSPEIETAHAEQIFSSMEALLKKRGLLKNAAIYSEERIIQADVNHDGIEAEMYFRCDADNRQIHILTVPKLILDEEKRQEALEYLNAINPFLCTGFFYIGSGIFIHCISFFYSKEKELDEERFSDYTDGVLLIVADYYDDLCVFAE